MRKIGFRMVALAVYAVLAWSFGCAGLVCAQTQQQAKDAIALANVNKTQAEALRCEVEYPKMVASEEIMLLKLLLAKNPDHPKAFDAKMMLRDAIGYYDNGCFQVNGSDKLREMGNTNLETANQAFDKKDYANAAYYADEAYDLYVSAKGACTFGLARFDTAYNSASFGVWLMSLKEEGDPPPP